MENVHLSLVYISFVIAENQTLTIRGHKRQSVTCYLEFLVDIKKCSFGIIHFVKKKNTVSTMFLSRCVERGTECNGKQSDKGKK